MSDSDKMVKPYTYLRICTEVRVNWKALCLCDIDVKNCASTVAGLSVAKNGEGEKQFGKEKAPEIIPNMSS